MTRFLVVGEALVDVVPDGTGGVRELPGGSPANVALTLGRLGRDVRLCTALAPDDRGDLVREWLRSSDVDVRATTPTTRRLSGMPCACLTSACRAGGTPKNNAPSPWSTAASSMSIAAIPVSTSQ